MAIIHGGMQRATIKYPDIDLSKIKLIGWGAGQWFRDYFPLLNTKISYTVCPIADNVGKVIHGVPVNPTSALRDEDPDKVFILIIASHHNEIMNQIREIGDFKCMRAITFGMDGCALTRDLIALQENIDNIPNYRSKRPSNIGFFYQGPIFPYTELALAYQREKYPNDYHCLVTNYNSKEATRRCARWVDEIIEIEEADRSGYFVRNNMIRTARTGAAHIKQKGLDYCVRVRSGNIVFGDVADYIANSFGTDGTLNRGKIGFFMNWSWKNIPFHLSDAFMMARSSDMLDLWSVEEDCRLPSAPELQLTSDMHFSDLHKVGNEYYLWSNYAKKCGYPAETMKDYLEFMLRKTLPLEPKVTTYSLKHLSVFNLDHDNRMSPDQQWWESLNNNFDLEYQRSLSRFNGNFSISDYWSGRVG